MAIKGDYLRVSTPITTDGKMIHLVNGQPQFREDHFAPAARKMLEAKNELLPETLRRKIELVSASQPVAPKRAVKAPAVVEHQLDGPEVEEPTEVTETKTPTPKKKGKK